MSGPFSTHDTRGRRKGIVLHGPAWRGVAGRGRVWYGVAGSGEVRFGRARQGFHLRSKT